MNVAQKFSVITIAALGLAACGGGGGSDSTAPSENTATSFVTAGAIRFNNNQDLIPVVYAYDVAPDGNITGSWSFQDRPGFASGGDMTGQMTASGDITFTLDGTDYDGDCRLSFTGNGYQTEEDMLTLSYGESCDHPNIMLSSNATVLWDSKEDISGYEFATYISQGGGNHIALLMFITDGTQSAAVYREYRASTTDWNASLTADWIMTPVWMVNPVQCSNYNFERLVFVDIENPDNCVILIEENEVDGTASIHSSSDPSSRPHIMERFL